MTGRIRRQPDEVKKIDPVSRSLVTAANHNIKAAVAINRKSSGAYTVMLFALIAFGVLVVLLFGTMVYGAVNNVRVDTDNDRASLSIVANAIRFVDSPDAIGYAKGPEGDALVLLEDTSIGKYENRFYIYGGNLVQEYARQGISYDPQKASPIAETEKFDFQYKDGLLTVETDQGKISVAIRSLGE